MSYAVEVADVLIRASHVPFVPHLYFFFDMHRPHSYETWLAQDLAWLPQCEAVVRIPGYSRGADIEEAHARELGIPVFHGVLNFLDACRLHPMDRRMING